MLSALDSQNLPTMLLGETYFNVHVHVQCMRGSCFMLHTHMAKLDLLHLHTALHVGVSNGAAARCCPGAGSFPAEECKPPDS